MGGSAGMGSDVAVISASQMQSIKGLVDPVLDQSVLSTVELQRMKDTASGEIERRAAAAGAAKQAAEAEKIAKAKARKHRMAELEEQRKREVPPTDIEQAKMNEKAAARPPRQLSPSSPHPPGWPQGCHALPSPACSRRPRANQRRLRATCPSVQISRSPLSVAERAPLVSLPGAEQRRAAAVRGA
jgi:hypothetical protein